MFNLKIFVFISIFLMITSSRKINFHNDIDLVSPVERCIQKKCYQEAEDCFSNDECMATQHHCFDLVGTNEELFYNCAKVNQRADTFLTCLNQKCKIQHNELILIIYKKILNNRI